MRKTWASAFVFIILSLNAIDAFTNPVPDTGQSCEGSCPSPGQPYYGQDGNYNINPPSYTKLDGTGKALLDSATSWVMVLDNVTGLIWEMKTNGDNVVNYNDIHDADNLYTYYLSYQDYHPVSGFIDALNSAYFGSYNDWRVPDIKELFSLLNFSDKLSQTAISINYFLYLSGSMSSTACVWPGYTMWCSAFRSGGYGPNSRSEGATVRAVRGFGYYGYGSSYKINL